jgi:hypothetical protein
VPRSLELVVTAVATRLMAVNAATSVEASQQVLAELIEHFDVDVSFLRHNDHQLHAIDRGVAGATRCTRPGSS